MQNTSITKEYDYCSSISSQIRFHRENDKNQDYDSFKDSDWNGCTLLNSLSSENFTKFSLTPNFFPSKDKSQQMYFNEDLLSDCSEDDKTKCEHFLWMRNFANILLFGTIKHFVQFVLNQDFKVFGFLFETLFI